MIIFPPVRLVNHCFLAKSSHGSSFSSFAVALSSGSQHSILLIKFKNRFLSTSVMHSGTTSERFCLKCIKSFRINSPGVQWLVVALNLGVDSIWAYHRQRKMVPQRSQQHYCIIYLRGYEPRGSISNAACFFRVRPVTLARVRVKRSFQRGDAERYTSGFGGPGIVLDQQVDPKSKNKKISILCSSGS